jgi:hypothetical protein
MKLLSQNRNFVLITKRTTFSTRYYVYRGNICYDFLGSISYQANVRSISFDMKRLKVWLERGLDFHVYFTKHKIAFL